MQMITVGPSEMNLTNFTGELRKAVQSFPSGELKVVIAFMPADAGHESYLRTMSRIASVPVVGATHGGISFTERGFRHAAISCALLGGADLDVQCAVARGIKANLDRSVAAACKTIAEGYKTHRDRAGFSVLLFADAFAYDGEAMLTLLRKNLPGHARCFGGNAADNWTFTGTKVFLDGEALADAAVFAGLYSQQRVEMAAQHGWCPIDGGRTFVITAAEGNIIKTLDNRPAYEVYSDELKKHQLLLPGETPVSAMAKFELGASTPFGDELKVRTPLSYSASDGSIALTASLPTGTVVRVVHGGTERMVAAAANLRKKVASGLNPVTGMFVVDCAGRAHLLGSRFEEEYEAFRAATDVPMIGTTAYGEIAKFGGAMEGFHNTTAVVAAF